MVVTERQITRREAALERVRKSETDQTFPGPQWVGQAWNDFRRQALVLGGVNDKDEAREVADEYFFGIPTSEEEHKG